VLCLVFANRHEIGLIQQNIGRHQRWVIKKTDARLCFLLWGFLLELGHALHPAQRDAAIQDPSQLSMSPHVGLNEHCGQFGIYASGKKQPGDLAYL
jgi:hypothetical protein